MGYFYDQEHDRFRGERIIIWVLVAIVAFIGSLVIGLPAFNRYQERQQKTQDRQQAVLDARNRVHVSNIEIKNQEQRIRVAQQRAEIRRQNAIGIREAQDQIAKTLTPLYVQFEMTQALQAIAKSGRNNSVVYLPSGANGIPLVSTVNPDQVQQPDH